MMHGSLYYILKAHAEAVPIFSCLRKRTNLEICKALATGLSISLLILSIVGTFGYLGVTDDVTSDLLLSYKQDDVVMIGVLLMGLKAISTYPAVFFNSRY